MKALSIVWPAVSLILIIAGLIIISRHERNSKKGKIGYLLLTIGSFLSAAYFFTLLLIK